MAPVPARGRDMATQLLTCREAFSRRDMLPVATDRDDVGFVAVTALAKVVFEVCCDSVKLLLKPKETQTQARKQRKHGFKANYSIQMCGRQL